MTKSTPSHYEGSGTIEKQEYLIEMLIERGMDAARAFDAATAVKYTDRAGRKDGESDEKDLGKAADYLFRAVYDVWPWEHAAIHESEESSTQYTEPGYMLLRDFQQGCGLEKFSADGTNVYDANGNIVCKIQEEGQEQ